MFFTWIWYGNRYIPVQAAVMSVGRRWKCKQNAVLVPCDILLSSSLSINIVFFIFNCYLSLVKRDIINNDFFFHSQYVRFPCHLTSTFVKTELVDVIGWIIINLCNWTLHVWMSCCGIVPVMSKSPQKQKSHGHL